MSGQTANSNRSLPTIAIVTALPALSFFLFGPLGVFDSNREEFTSGILSWQATLVPMAGIAWAILILIGTALRGSWRDGYLGLSLALGCLIWAQSNFLVHDYGELDGRGLNWEAFSGLAYLDILLWIGLAWIALVRRDRLVPLLMPAALLLLAVQLLAAIPMLTGFKQADWFGEPDGPSGPPESLFEYSKEHNIVHVVLDNFQTDIFKEIVEEEGLESAFDGFILFTENAAAAPYTSLAIPSIFLGHDFDGQTTDSEFYKRAAEQGLPSQLYDHGYRVNLSLILSMTGTRHSTSFRIPDLLDDSPKARARSEALQAVDLMLFRSVPHLARNWVYNDHNWRIARLFDDSAHQSRAFAHRNYLRNYAEQLRVVDARPSYHFIHVWPPHPPYVTNADGSPASTALPNTRENYKNEARATVFALLDLFQALRENDLYDGSMIVVQSDHGGAFEPAFTPKRMLALLAVKRKDSEGPLQYSRAQTSVTDVAATIYSDQGLDSNGDGLSVFDIPETQTRARHYTMYHGSAKDSLQIVRIAGSLYTPDSYEYLEPRPRAVHRPKYRYGTLSNVGLEGEATGYLGRGWSSPFPNIVWNNGYEATLDIPIDASEHPLALEMWLIPGTHGKVWPKQRIILRVGNTEVARWELRERLGTKIEASIPAELTDTDRLVLSFDFPDAVRQYDLGVGQDKRLQAIALGRFRLREMDNGAN